MDGQIAISFFRFEKAKARVEEVFQKEQNRRSLIQTATLFKTILTQQTLLESKQLQESHDKSSLKQDMTKIQHEKKLLENKVALLGSEVETWKKKSSNHRALEKENLTLKTQISKLNGELQRSKNETTNMTQKLVTQKAVLETKLENAKKNIKTLKDKPMSPTKQPLSQKHPPQTQIRPQTLMSLDGPTPKVHGKNGLLKPLVSNFSVSPFLAKRRQTSPERPSASSLLANRGVGSIPADNESTPVSKIVLAQSTPETVPMNSPLKLLQRSNKPSSLKNLMSPDRSIGSNTSDGPEAPLVAAKQTKTKKASLFDLDDDDDDDGFFGASLQKLKVEPPVVTKTEQEPIAGETTLMKANKKRKKKIGTKSIVDDEEGDDVEEGLKVTTLKRVKLMDKLTCISPLKQRNKERNLFKV